jgi:Ser/Thr protein kinase RdoA (MazF antagonist)
VTPLGTGRFGPEQLVQRLELVLQSGRQPLIEAANSVREQLARSAGLRDPQLPVGVVHTDLFRDNVLWRGDEIAALIDFESAATGRLAYDLMVTLLAWCYTDSFEQELMQGLLEGYHELRPLSEAELSALELEGELACLRFATTRMTDFSLRVAPGVPPARDFGRFLQRMAALQAGALTPVLDALRTRGVGAKLP